MKKTILLLSALMIIANCTLKIDDCRSQWVQMSNGMGNDKTISSFLIDGNNIYAGTQSYGVYVSTNFGLNWTQSGMNNQWVKSFVINGSNIFAGTYLHGVWLTTDNGASWHITSMNNATVSSLAISGNTIFAGQSFFGVKRSTDNGANWTQMGPANRTINSLSISGNNIYASSDSSVFISTNFDTNWVLTPLNGQLIHTLTALGSSVYAGTDNGIFSTTNNGINWAQIGLNTYKIHSLTSFGGNIFAGASYGGYYYVFLSTNNGANWLDKTQGFNPVPIITELLISNNYIFAGTNSFSVWRRDYLEIIGIKQISGTAPSKYSLSQNYPNPFNPITNVKFSIVNSGQVILIVYDVQGRELQTLVNESLKPGTYATTFDGSMLTSGVYFYRLTAGDFSETKRMILLK
ncbi:MAG: T9SS type A sorting domain-containing protein [Ignavibacteria bacterium]|nr:T9SS type A sorting domain-containing protein [Ignavibacteria bacterium]